MSATPAGVAALGIVTLLLLASLVRQWGLPSRLAMFDLLGILPGWAFFIGPRGEYDLALAVRGQREDGNFGAWQECAAAQPRRPWQWLWYPEAYAASTLGQLIDMLDRRQVAGRPADADSSLAYDRLLAVTRARLGGAGFATVQFALVQRAGGDRAITFTSALHPC